MKITYLKKIFQFKKYFQLRCLLDAVTGLHSLAC